MTRDKRPANTSAPDSEIRDEAAQSAVVAMLEATLPGPVERIDTHVSRLFLTPQHAFKLKRARKLGYVDFTDPARRRACCAAELKVNGAGAPGLYLGLCNVMRGADGGLSLGGKGTAVDYLVEMRRLPSDALLSEMAAAGKLEAPILDAVADAVLAMHAAAPQRPGGGAAAMAEVLAINEAAFATSTIIAADRIAALNARFRAALTRHAATLDRRAAQGRHRRCHGDLHLGNMIMWQGRPCPFDAIEFSEALATCDTGYDTAFLLMDLWQTGLHEGASRVANRIADADDEEMFPLLPFFMAVRAAVRAHVTATRAEDEASADTRSALAGTAEQYLSLADTLLAPPAPRLIALGGLSGSGKTTLARAIAPMLAPPPGARVIESDITRKALFGVPPETRLPPAAYVPPVSAQVYEAMAARAAGLVAAGCPVIVTAVHSSVAERAGIETAAGGTRFDGIALAVPAATLRRRIGRRAQGASDATLAVLERQLAVGLTAAGSTAEGGWREIDASGSEAATTARLAAALGLSPALHPRSELRENR